MLYSDIVKKLKKEEAYEILAFVMLAVEFMLRPFELCSLTWEQIDEGQLVGISYNRFLGITVSGVISEEALFALNCIPERDRTGKIFNHHLNYYSRLVKTKTGICPLNNLRHLGILIKMSGGNDGKYAN